MVFNQTEKQERSYLQQIINRLKQIISHTNVSVKDHVDTLAEYKDYLWNNKDIDPVSYTHLTLPTNREV